jgi:hypothetical protein
MSLSIDEAVEVARRHLLARRLEIARFAGAHEYPECFSVSFESPLEDGEVTKYLRVEVDKDTGRPRLMLSY